MCHRSCVVFPHGVSGRVVSPHPLALIRPPPPSTRSGHGAGRRVATANTARPRLLGGEGSTRHGTARRGASTGRDGTCCSAWRNHGAAHGERRRERWGGSAPPGHSVREICAGASAAGAVRLRTAQRALMTKGRRPPRAAESVSERLRRLAVGVRALDACGAPEQGTTRCDESGETVTRQAPITARARSPSRKRGAGQRIPSGPADGNVCVHRPDAKLQSACPVTSASVLAIGGGVHTNR